MTSRVSRLVTERGRRSSTNAVMSSGLHGSVGVPGDSVFQWNRFLASTSWTMFPNRCSISGFRALGISGVGERFKESTAKLRGMDILSNRLLKPESRTQSRMGVIHAPETSLPIRVVYFLPELFESGRKQDIVARQTGLS
jgi:hypothetical protein